MFIFKFCMNHGCLYIFLNYESSRMIKKSVIIMLITFQ